VSLTPIVITLVLVAAVFIGTSVVLVRWGRPAGNEASPAPVPSWRAALRAAWLPGAAEALVLTLLAALWFASLGHGGWVLLFLLFGALTGGWDAWLRRRLAGAPGGPPLWPFVASLLRYLAAGAVCAWCLT